MFVVPLSEYRQLCVFCGFYFYFLDEVIGDIHMHDDDYDYPEHDETYVRDCDDDNPGMDSNQEYREPRAPYGDASGDYLDRMDSELKGCFIATAAWGSPLAAQVVLLQNFRDDYLVNRAWGRMFVGQYYRFSPSLAKYVENREKLKSVLRLLLTPLVIVVKKAGFVR